MKSGPVKSAKQELTSYPHEGREKEHECYNLNNYSYECESDKDTKSK